MTNERSEEEALKQDSGKRLARRRWAMLGLVLGYCLSAFSVSLLIAPREFRVIIINILEENALTVSVGVVGGVIALSSFFQILSSRQEERRFEELDDDVRLETHLSAARERAKKKENVEPLSYVVSDEINSDLDESFIRISSDDSKDFSSYYLSISHSLEKRSSLSDRKASLLLDMGTGYAKGGIIFLIFSIIIWQTISFFVGFVDQVIYGIASCSLIFMFVEFLSVWFLRQYRNFVDTSTYLMKVKAIFDRFMLSYLALQDYSEVPYEEKKDLIDRFVSSLGDELVWPDKGQAKSKDLGFANEAVDAMTKMMRLIKAKNATSDR